MDDIHYQLINDSLNELEIVGGSNMIQNVLLEENNHEMTLSNENKCLFASNNDDITVTIHYSQLEGLYFSGYGDITSLDTIKQNLKIQGQDCFSTINLLANTDSLYIALEGSPQLTLSGAGNYFYAYIVGSGNYHCEEFYTQHCHGHNRGAGDIHLRADDSYIVELRASGDIYLHDTINTSRFYTITGSGSIVYP